MKLIDIFLNRVFIVRFSIIFIILFNLVLWFKNFSYFYKLLTIGGDWRIAVSTVYDLGFTYSSIDLVFALIVLTLTSVNFSLFSIFWQKMKDLNTSLGKDSIISLLSMLLLHCTSCGGAILGGFVSFGALSVLPFAGREISVLLILILIYSTRDIIKKIRNPYVC
jgi:hypothetical protein